MSSMTLIARRTVPSGSNTGVAFTRDQRHSRVPAMRLRTISGSGRSPAQRAPAREPLDRERPAVLVGHLEAARDLAGRRGEQLLDGVVADHPHRGVVGVDERAVGRLRRDGVGDAAEDRVDLLARVPGGGGRLARAR